ncbi:restriction endonuclease [Haladaptatus sp. CMAA 1911]|uniref:restriction endonuclease n=1 Tax=unclassified Haladaptatus TaxID=2622732 RepID=UPI003754EC4A
MIRQIPDEEFPEFVAALWKKQGWQTTVTEKSGKSFVALQRDGGEGLIWADPETGENVSGQDLQQFVRICQKYGVDEGAVVTPGTFSEDAEKIGEQTGVQLVDGEKLRTIVEARELHDFVERFVEGGDGSDGDGEDGDGFSLPVSLPNGVPRKAVAGVFVALLAIVAAAVVAPTILGTGGDVRTSGGWNVTANSTAPSDATGALDVGWNTKRVSKVNPERGNGVYKPDDGEEFLLVSMNVTNSGSDSLGLRPQDFALRSNGTLRGYQPLNDTQGFQPSVLDSDESVSVWFVFSIDDDATNATIVTTGRLRRDHVRTKFTHDETLAVET